MSGKPIALAITGASGAPYALRLLALLIGAGRPVYLMISDAGRIVMKEEVGLELPPDPTATADLLGRRYGAADGQLRVFAKNDWFAPVASGSSAPEAMVICPCSGGTLAAVAHGLCNNLLERAADVVIKEQRKLIIVPREAPVSVIHLENMLKLARLGAVILPASPGFYYRPQGLDDIVDFVVARVLDQLGVETAINRRWGAVEAPEDAGRV